MCEWAERGGDGLVHIICPKWEVSRMTLDEAIKHCEEVADYDCYNEKQLKCAEEHWQLAEWLRELKAYKENEWIPRSEPPKNEGTYLVYAPDYMGGSSSAKENYNGVMFSKYKNGKWSIEHGYYERPNCVKAWRPLPGPYRGDQDE